jgi:hypothetical protein
LRPARGFSSWKSRLRASTLAQRVIHRRLRDLAAEAGFWLFFRFERS